MTCCYPEVKNDLLKRWLTKQFLQKDLWIKFQLFFTFNIIIFQVEFCISGGRVA